MFVIESLNSAALKLKSETIPTLSSFYSILLKDGFVRNYYLAEMKRIVDKAEKNEELFSNAYIENYKNAVHLLEEKKSFDEMSRVELFWLLKCIERIGAIPYEAKAILVFEKDN